MKAILICPGRRSAVADLAEFVPLAAVPILGESLLVYWLVHLAAQGATEVTVLAADRPNLIRQLAGDGARWGLRVNVVAVPHEPTVAEARARRTEGEGWLAAPYDVILADHLPGQTQRQLCAGYAEWFAGVQEWFDHALTPDRTGVRTVAPGIRVGRQTVIPDDAVLVAPCWIGEKVQLGAGVHLGPGAVIEDRAVIGDGAEVMRSIIGPDTWLGEHTEVTDSLASGDLLINWCTGSTLRVAEEWLLSSLRQPVPDATEWFRRFSQLITGENAPLVPVDRLTTTPPL